MTDQLPQVRNWTERLGFHDAPPMVNQRVNKAAGFYHENFPPRPNETASAYEKRTLDFLKGIDFNRDVEVRRLKKGEELIQYRYQAAKTKDLKKTGGKPGNYFSYRGTPQQRLGITEGEVRRRKFSRYEVVRSTNVLECTAGSTRDTWTNPKIREVTLPNGKTRRVKVGVDVRGGGRQIVVPQPEKIVRRVRATKNESASGEISAKRTAAKRAASPTAEQSPASPKKGPQKFTTAQPVQIKASAGKPRKGMRM